MTRLAPSLLLLTVLAGGLSACDAFLDDEEGEGRDRDEDEEDEDEEENEQERCRARCEEISDACGFGDATAYCAELCASASSEKLACLEDAGCDEQAAAACEGGPSTWTCDASWRDAGDGCDCGCGAVDGDCASAAASACEFSHCPSGKEPMASNNAACVALDVEGEGEGEGEGENEEKEPGDGCDCGSGGSAYYECISTTRGCFSTELACLAWEQDGEGYCVIPCDSDDDCNEGGFCNGTGYHDALGGEWKSCSA